MNVGDARKMGQRRDKLSCDITTQETYPTDDIGLLELPRSPAIASLLTLLFLLLLLLLLLSFHL